MIPILSVPTDTTIEANVRDALQQRLGAHASDIGIDVFHRVVTLIGHASMQERYLAESIVEAFPGVRAVANDIELPVGDQPSDSAIAEAAVDALAGISGTDVYGVKVIARRGWLTLSGCVPSEAVRAAAEHAVEVLPGVRGVSNVLFIGQ